MGDGSLGLENLYGGIGKSLGDSTRSSGLRGDYLPASATRALLVAGGPHGVQNLNYCPLAYQY